MRMKLENEAKEIVCMCRRMFGNIEYPYSIQDIVELERKIQNKLELIVGEVMQDESLKRGDDFEEYEKVELMKC